MTDDAAPDFGELDGEPIEAIVVKVSGSGMLERKPGEGERGILTIEGNFASPVVKRINGRLVREVALKAELIAEPIDQLAVDVERFIQDVEDRRSGRLKLPFDPETGEILEGEDEPGEPEPGAEPES